MARPPALSPQLAADMVDARSLPAGRPPYRDVVDLAHRSPGRPAS